MVVGAGSESFRTLCYLVERLPVMIAPALAADDRRSRSGSMTSIAYLRAGAATPAAAGARSRSAAPDVLSYGEMLDVMAARARQAAAGDAAGARC